jgi:hypothetical protein
MGGDVQLRSDLFVREALAHHLKHFPLSQGEVFWKSSTM